MAFRTDRNNNPIAFTTDIARQAGLLAGVDYTQGDSFNSGVSVMFTAKLLKDPVNTCVKVIDKIGFYTKSGLIRWIYIGMPDWVCNKLTRNEKRQVVYFMYKHEGGTELEKLFNQ
jgi:hypothetical protein